MAVRAYLLSVNLSFGSSIFASLSVKVSTSWAYLDLEFVQKSLLLS